MYNAPCLLLPYPLAPKKIAQAFFLICPWYYSRPKRNRKKTLNKIFGSKQGAIWSV